MRHFVTFAKKLTVLATLFTLLQGVCMAESSKQDFSDPRETFTFHIGEVTASDGYITSPLNVIPSLQNLQTGEISFFGASALPSSYDMRDYGYVTSVKDQSSLGVCWAFSGLSNLESYILRHIDSGANPDFSENHLRFSMSKYASDGTWLWGDDRYPHAGGNFLRTTSYLSRGGGPVDDSVDPYQNNSNVYRTVSQLKSENGIKENLPIDIGDGNYLSGSNGLYTLTDTTMLAMTSDRDTNIDLIKRAVYETNAVDIGIYWNTSYYVNGAAVYCDVPILMPNHEVNIIGWDDSYLKSNFKKTESRTFTVTDSYGTQTQVTYGGTTPDGDGAFLVKNSWGSDDGEDGYYWISYYDMIFSRSDAEACYVSGVSTKTYDNIYQYDPLLASAWITPTSSQAATFSAVFNAKYGERVSAAGFYTFNENCNYRIFIDDSFSTSSDSIYATLPTKVAEGYLPNAGYHMIEFDDFYVKTSSFALIVEITCLDSGMLPCIMFEMPVTGANSNAAANSGETYFNVTSVDAQRTRLFDSTAYADATASVCLKAFTNDPEPDSGLSGYVSYSALSGNGNAVFNLANNTGETQNAMCITAVYKDGLLENAFTANAEDVISVSTVDVPFTVSSSDCVVKSMIFYEDSIRPVTPKSIVRRLAYLPLSPDFATKKIYLKPGDSKCINIIDGDIDATERYVIESSDTSIVSVNGGTLTAGNTPGYTTITATYLSKTVTADVYVLY